MSQDSLLLTAQERWVLVEQLQLGATPPKRIRYRCTRLQRVLPVPPLLVVVWGTKVWDWMTWTPAGSEIAESLGMWVAALFVLLVLG
ncbi:hypothetical protein [Streptomyces sp. NBC_01643]|uniref:hypothetical protein n=1 Tax=Streptomyces sp. NBC_01643 TaxID=2975906 RepID=UPI003869F5AB|nr:hypothetical protein OHB03_45230 [Streptomyces sp. NBC_01643]